MRLFSALIVLFLGSFGSYGWTKSYGIHSCMEYQNISCMIICLQFSRMNAINRERERQLKDGGKDKSAEGHGSSGHH